MIRSLYFLSILTLSAYLGGCASTPKAPVIITGSASAPQALPYSHSAESFTADVTARVGDAAKDEAIRQWLKSGLDKGAATAIERFEFANNEAGRAKLVDWLTKKQLGEALVAGGGFIMTKKSNIYGDKGEIKNVSVRLGTASDDSQPFSGSMTIGKSFSYYNSSTRETTYDQESYAAKLDGSLAWLADGTLNATWKLTEGEHKSSFGLDSKFSLAGASEELARTITGVRAKLDAEYAELVTKTATAVKSRIAGRYVSKEVKASDAGAFFKEATYPVEHKTAIARIQRLYGQWKFDPTDSTFSMKENSRYDDVAKNWVRFSLMVSLFPEGNKTVVVFKVPHTSVQDQITQQVIFGVREAAESFTADIAAIEAKLSK